MTADEWAHKIKAGDVIKAPSGLLRVVREVRRNNALRRKTCVYARNVWVTLVIQRCSWTTRAYTSFTVGELYQLGYIPTRARYNVNTEFDEILLQDQQAKNASECQLHCCDVRGIA